MLREELMDVIEFLKEYDLIESFDFVMDAEKWLTNLDYNSIKNIRNMQHNESVLNSQLRRVLINKNLLSSNSYMKFINAFLKLENVENLDDKLRRVCNRIGISEIADNNLIEYLNIISKMANVEMGLELLMNENFYESFYKKSDLTTIASADEIHEEYLCKVAKSPDSINSDYHEADMQEILNCKESDISFLTKLACAKYSLLSPTHRRDMDLLKICPEFARNSLYELMTNYRALFSKNYELMRASIINSSSNKKAYAKYYFIVRDAEMEQEKLEYLLASIEGMSDDIVSLYSGLLTRSEFVNNPYIKEDIDLLSSIDSYAKFNAIYRLLLNENFLNSKNHLFDIKCILEENDMAKIDLLLSIAEDAENLASDNHKFDMNYARNINIELLDEETVDYIYYYLFDADGINDIDHVESLTRLSQGDKCVEEEKSPVSLYFKKLEKTVINFKSGEDIDIFKTK